MMRIRTHAHKLFFLDQKNKHKILMNELEIIKSTLFDIDNDIHELDEKD